MAKAKSRQRAVPETRLDERGGKKKGGSAPKDTCEFVVAELKARRKRLAQLLALVETEALRMEVAHGPLARRHRCAGPGERPAAKSFNT